ncbi:MAG: hypothetical protein JJ920_18110 [Roseitalea sp.]|jgi:sensor domain CHASE-containing protein|nr:hypothetical protein [Roseitalea sp.]MBO6721854.1 hypothetical protein [Roseitalea sp.]MBO6744832.1 hypothetical protein [Roseitalea sp.]
MQTQSTAELIAAWLPFLVLLAVVWVGYRYSMKHYRSHVDEVNAVNQQIVDTNREMIAELKEIKQILKDQN